MRFKPGRRAVVRAVSVIGSLAMAVGLLTGVTAVAAAPAAAAGVTPVASAGIGQVKAADLSKFNPGRIITDAVFFDSGTMSEAQIQQFLESKVRSCQSGYTCLRDKWDTTRATSADAMCGAYNGGGNERASTIIYKVARACGINPQVILVMLEKEQSLVSHTWPSDYRYRAAMGQGCPDTAACDTRYYGFFNQVYGGAWQLKRYANPPGTSNFFNWYAPGRTWNILYNPNHSCGSSPVYIENQATSNLYYYTPYQPNAAALRAGYGEGDGCSAYGNRNFFNFFNDWFGPTTGPENPNGPFGSVESVAAVPGAFQLSGWAIDPDSSDPIALHVYVNGVGRSFVADLARNDVGAAYPHLGARHGFSVTVPVTAPGVNDICIYGINIGAGSNSLFSCSKRDAIVGNPFGMLESATSATGGISVSGWAIDPDTAGPMPVHVYVGSTGSALTADLARNDVGGAYPAYGPNHGYSKILPAQPGTHNVCAYGINVGHGYNVDLGCRQVTVTAPADSGRPPIGNFEGLSVNGSVVTASGWAIDPDTALPISVRLESAAARATVTADRTRTDVGGAYPGFGPDHGFIGTLTLPAGSNEVCAWAVNTGTGGDTMLGCRTVAIALPDLGRAPVGVLEQVSVSGTTANVSGWALDLDTASGIQVHIYVNGRGSAYWADKTRNDIGAAFPAQGANHAFAEQIPLPTGTSNVCAYAINNGAGGSTDLGCRQVTVADHSRPPFGNLEAVLGTAGAISVGGWAIDPDTTNPIAVHVYVNGVGTAHLADAGRADVGAAYPGYGDRHGFGITLPAAPGTYNVCVYPINDGGPGNAWLGCRDVVVT